MKHARVLVVDTDRRLRTQLYTRLLDVDVFSDSVSNGNEAMEYLRDRNYGVVLLDLELATNEAHAVIDYIRAQPADHRPIILATAAREVTVALDAELVQIVIRKPLRLADVADMIRSCVYHARSSTDIVPGFDESVDGAVEGLVV